MQPVTATKRAHPQADGRSARWEAHRRTRRRELLRAVRRALEAAGPDASMDEISAHTGTSKTVLYRYFGDRAGLQTAVGEWAMRAIARSLDEASAEAAGPDDALEAMIRAFSSLAHRSPAVYRFCDAAVPSSPDASAGGFLADVADLLCERMGLTADADRLWAVGAIGFVRACTLAWIEDPSISPGEPSGQGDPSGRAEPASADDPVAAQARAVTAWVRASRAGAPSD